MIKLKDLLKESTIWDRKFGEPLLTFQDVMQKHQQKNLLSERSLSGEMEELKVYIYELQNFVKDEQKKGKDVDTILDETDIFHEFEAILPDDEFPIFVITILNGFQSDIIIDKLLDVIDECKNEI